MLVQSPETAKFDGMRAARWSTGVADKTKRRVDGRTLNAISTRRLFWSLSLAEDDQADASPHGRILVVLRERYGIDFTLYKPEPLVIE